MTAAVLLLGVAMQTLSRPIPPRIVQYHNQANRVRRMAETEPIKAIRDELLAVARQYDNLAEGLKSGAPFVSQLT